MNNCKLSFICSQQWIELKKGDDSAVRHCETCKTDVFAVYNTTEFEQHRSQGHCVALSLDDDVCTMGMPDIGGGDGDGDGLCFDPILYRPPSELEELPANVLKALDDYGLKRIGDIIGLKEGKVLELLQGSHSDLSILTEVLAGRGLALDMQLGDWMR